MFQKHTYDLNGHKNSNSYTIIKLYSRFRTETGRKTFAHQGALLFNKLPRELKGSSFFTFDQTSWQFQTFKKIISNLWGKHKASQYHDGDFIPDTERIVTNIGIYLKEHGILYKISL